jgi:hypothetical protein
LKLEVDTAGGAMARYLVTYELQDLARAGDVAKRLCELGAQKLTASSYLVDTEDAWGIVSFVRKVTDQINIYVLRIRRAEEYHAYFRGK